MFTMTKHYRAFVRVVAPNPFKYRRTVVQRVRHYVNLRVFPAHHLAIEPNVISFFRRHFSSFCAQARICCDVAALWQIATCATSTSLLN
ncbi:Uncharacterised protein [Salmonella enterica subsp. enterica]|uniref:Uncharacterized protein n=1 Tax=Salmonella enterica I TaxID=59201 RepID=A0A447PSU9_SALET|nr:Uncharacterised protein [Salmonella enterica subsp. enterica]